MALERSVRKLVASTIALGVFATLAAVGVNITYTKQSVVKSNHQWCELLKTLDEAYGQTPPQSETGRKVAEEIHRLSMVNGCYKS
jgi:hypothetical protein